MLLVYSKAYNLSLPSPESPIFPSALGRVGFPCQMLCRQQSRVLGPSKGPQTQELQQRVQTICGLRSQKFCQALIYLSPQYHPV